MKPLWKVKGFEKQTDQPQQTGKDTRTDRRKVTVMHKTSRRTGTGTGEQNRQPGHHRTIQYLIPGWTSIVKLLKQVKNWQSPSRDPWSNCLIKSREDDKGQSYYYSDRQKDNSKTICGHPGYSVLRDMWIWILRLTSHNQNSVYRWRELFSFLHWSWLGSLTGDAK